MHAELRTYEGEELYAEAERFVRRCYEELGKEGEIEARLAEVEAEIAERGHYDHTYEELAHGARMAWRNSNRCIGRLFWDNLRVIDQRDCETAEEVRDALVHHLEFATNDGNILPTISVFEPMVRGERQVRIWNHQLVRYAGYDTDDGVVGDPAEVAFTEYCRSRGWEGEGTEFDVLPHVVQIEDREPELFEVPDDVVAEVEITHPEYEWFEDLGLQWYGVPVVSDMRLEIGGIQYTAAPFNGWYMDTEIGARDFGDEERYDMLPEVAERLGHDTGNDRSLWKDEAELALNRAVLHSYDEAGVTIVDHHNAAEQFRKFEQEEAEAGREVTGDWSWLVPPSAGSTTHMFHTSYDDSVDKPNFFYQDSPDPLADDGVDSEEESEGCPVSGVTEEEAAATTDGGCPIHGLLDF